MSGPDIRTGLQARGSGQMTHDLAGEGRGGPPPGRPPGQSLATPSDPEPPAVSGPDPQEVWSDALAASALIALDPRGFGGAWIKAQAGPVRDRFVQGIRDLRSHDAPFRKMPAHIAEDRLIGGLDLTASLSSGRAIAQRGLLAEADGGIVVLPMAERLMPIALSRIAEALDGGSIRVERDGIAACHDAHIGVLALDEGGPGDDPLGHGLVDRLGFHLDLSHVPIRVAEPGGLTQGEIDAARPLYDAMAHDSASIETLCALAAAFGVSSVRAALFAIRTACGLAALDGRKAIDEDDIEMATRLIILPRATQVPAPPPEDDAPEDAPPPEPEEQTETPPDDTEQQIPESGLEDSVQDAEAALIPKGLLEKLAVSAQRSMAAQSTGGKGALKQAEMRGRPIGSRPGRLDGRARLHVVDTLRAAAPWQGLRQAEASRSPTSSSLGRGRIAVRGEDIRVRRFKERMETLTIFAVDASGSQALNRLGEAKGAVELLLADCYARRDQVALVIFRGQGAEVLLRPTRSLVRAKRALSGVPGGGGTPLAAGIDAVRILAEDASRKGQTAHAVFLTDGSANIAYDPEAGRAAAREDAHAAGNKLRASGTSAILIDTSPRPQKRAEEVAGALGAIYLPLPFANAQGIRQAVGVLPGHATPNG
jgi:magnesium chelatase subunit D